MIARLIHLCFGPGKLAFFLGFLVSVTALLTYYSFFGLVWDRHLFGGLLWGSAGGLLGAGIAAAAAQDAFLRESLARHRPLLALVTGLIAGGFIGLLSGFGWSVVAGALGGGIGGLAKSLVYPDDLDDGI